MGQAAHYLFIAILYIGSGDRGAMPPTPTFMGHCLQEKIKIL